MVNRALVYLLIASIPFGVLGRITIFPTVNLSIQDILVLLLVLVSSKDILKLFSYANKFVKLGVAFNLIGLLGIFVETRSLFEFLSSILYLVRLDTYLLAIVPIINLPKGILNKARVELLLAGAIFILFGYIQYIFYPNLRNLFYLGWDEHLYRFFGSLLDPNFAGAYIVLILLFYSASVFERYKSSQNYQRMLYLLGYVCLLPSLFLTYSRSSFLMLLSSFLLFFLLINTKRLILIFVLVFIVGLFLLPKDFGGEGVRILRTSSIFARQVEYVRAWRVFTDNPIIGVGFNSLRFVSGRYGFTTKQYLYVSHAAAGVPNSYLYILSTTGIAGFVIVAAFMTILIRKISRLGKKKILNASILASLFGILVQSLFENTLFYAPIMLWMAVIAGIFFGLSRKQA